MSKLKQAIAYLVGRLYQVAIDEIVLCPVELTTRFSLGNQIVSTTESLKAGGQAIACGAQLLTEAQRKAFPGKTLMLTEGRIRYEYAKANGVPLEVLIHAPYDDVTIFDRNLAANGPKSDLSVMDIAHTIARGRALGFQTEQLQIKLAFVAGRGKKQLHRTRFDQYERCLNYPIEIQYMIHDGLIKADAALTTANRALTSAQFEAMVNRAKDSRAREAHMEHEADLKYVERENDKALAAVMRGELPEAPVYVPKVGTKRKSAEVTASDPLNTAEMNAAAEAEGFGGKNKHKKDETAPTPIDGKTVIDGNGVLEQGEWLHLAAQMAARGSHMEALGKMLFNVATRKVSEAAFCAEVEAYLQKLSPKSKAKAPKELVTA